MLTLSKRHLTKKDKIYGHSAIRSKQLEHTVYWTIAYGYLSMATCIDKK